MDFSARNKKVALARWGKVLAREKASIPKTDDALRKKAALCGFLAGDGSVYATRLGEKLLYRICFFPDDAYMLSTYCELTKKLYGKLPHVNKKDGAYFDARITSRNMYEDICSVATFGIAAWTPPWSLFSTSGAREAWLRGFFSAEAYVGPKQIKIQTVNARGMRDVSVLLAEVGIEHRCYTYTPKNKNHSVVHIVFINKIDARKRFAEKIGFWHAKKTAALKKSLSL